MSVDEALRRGRARREELMRSTCRITRPIDDPVFNPSTGEYTGPTRAVIYEGICQIKPTFSPAEREGSSGEREAALNSYDLVLPYSAETLAVKIEDSVDFLESDDTWVIGKQLPVGWIDYADTRTHRRIVVWAQDRSGVARA